MFGLFKSDPRKKLQNDYDDLLKKAMDAQRRGDIRSYSQLNEKADGILKELNLLDKK